MDELLREAFGRFAREAAAQFERRMVEAATPEEAVQAVTLLVTHDVFATQRDLVLSHELYTLAARDPAFRTLTNDWMRRSREALGRHFDPTTCRALDAFVEGMTIHRALDTEPHDDADVLDAVRRLTGVPAPGDA
jgi:DNA-binding transcriptional regulator YbjK